MNVRPHPKPARRTREPIRVVDPTALKRALLLHRECVVCGRPATNGDHIIRRGTPHFGDDVVENIAPLCGSGSTGCHGARHGNPYVDSAGVRWTPEIVRAAIGEWIKTRPETLMYVGRKLGKDAGLEYLWRYFGVSGAAS